MPRWAAWLIVIAAVAAFLALPEIFPGNSRLYGAIGKSDVAEVDRLLRNGADPNSQASGLSGMGGGFEPVPEGSFSPLMYAIHRNEAECALLLIVAGAETGARNPKGDTALIAAAERDMTEVVHMLLGKGADPLAENSFDGSTALHLGPAFAVDGRRREKTHLDPAIVAMLRGATAN